MAQPPQSSGPFAFFDVQDAAPSRVAEARRDFLATLLDLLQELGGTGAPAEALGARLWKRMCAPGRHYHTPVHVLLILGQARRLGLELGADTQLAIWFHDSVYDPRAEPGDNEHASADWMCAQLSDVGVDSAVVEHAAESIRWTTRFLESEVPREHALVLDLDLIGLACAPGCFGRQSMAVRREQNHRTDAEYREATRTLFEALLARPSIYRTRELAPLEATARANLLRACADLLS